MNNMKQQNKKNGGINMTNENNKPEKTEGGKGLWQRI